MKRQKLLKLINRAARKGRKELRLSGRSITKLPPEIGQLTQLRKLTLSANSLMTLPPELGQLTQLQELDLNDNHLTVLPPELGRLAQLQKLELRKNRLRIVPPQIVQLTQLQSLALSANSLTSLSPKLWQLTQLRHLYLGGNALKDLPPKIGRLIHLQVITLNKCELTSLPPELWRLTKLTRLEINGNQLALLSSGIGQLTRLKFLYLGDNQLTALPPEISQLTQLQSFSLDNNQLTVILPEIGKLTQLQSLDFQNNQLTALPPGIGKLTQLQSLYLNGNRLTALSPEIGQLSQLQSLDLSDNRLTALPPEIGQLSQLQSFDLSGNQLRSFSLEIVQLTQLQSLNFSGNQLTVLPPEIGRLNQLQSLNLYGNQLTALPPEIGRLNQLQLLHLHRNPLPLPSEILRKIKKPADILRAWADYLTGPQRPLNEIKMVLVGEGSVGKTSLVNRLLDNTYNPHQTKTEGIAVHRWQLSSPPQAEGTEGEIRVNIWDFGGQEIMHATHQLFLTHRTLYLLVLDSRLTESENRLDYWLTLIHSFGGDSPILIVGNKTDQHQIDLDRRGLLAKHRNLQDILVTSCSTGAGIVDLRSAIAKQIAALPHVSDPLPTPWFEVKAHLETATADVLPYRDYIRICLEQGVDHPDSQRVLLGFLHDLGVALHFPDPRLDNIIFKSEWITQGIYRILNTRLPFKEQGILTWDVLTRILDDAPYRNHRIFIVDMMCKFELCYELLDRPHTYLIPDLLPKEECDTGAWDDALAFEVHYSVLPGSILTRLIVRMHRHVHTHDAGRTVWRRGVLLACEGNEALVKANLTANRITIRVRGPAIGRRELLSRIREHLEAIHTSLAGLQTAEKVPVPGHPNIPSVDYRWLRECEHRGLEQIMPEGVFTPINVRKLLDGVEPPEARRARSRDRARTIIIDSQVGIIGDEAEVKDGIHFDSPREH